MKGIADWSCVAVLASLAACGPTKLEPVVQEEPAVYTTFPPVVTIARVICGDAIDVVDVLPEGKHAASFRPSREDMLLLQSAPLIVLHGAEYESWALTAALPKTRVFELAGGQGTEFITVETVTHSHGEGPAHSHAGINPHLWLDPVLARSQAAALAVELIERFPDHAAGFESGAAAIDTELRTLHEAFQRIAPSLRGAALHSVHPCYAYAARRYGFSVADWTLGFEPDAETLSGYVESLDGRPCVFLVEDELDAARVETFDAAGVRVVHWPTGEREGDYLADQRAALARLERALGS